MKKDPYRDHMKVWKGKLSGHWLVSYWTGSYPRGVKAHFRTHDEALAYAIKGGCEMKVKKYVKKPIVIEAMEFGPTPTDAHSLTCWMSENLYVGLVGDATHPETLRYPDQAPGDNSRPDKGWYIDPATGDLIIRTLEGDMRVSPGDYVIRGVNGEFYSCNPDIFVRTYEKAE